MALSTQRAVSDGTLVQLSLSIEYFDRSEIGVYFAGVLIAENVVSSNGSKWNWVGTTDTKINFTPAIPDGVEVMVKRTSDMVAPRHEYTKGAQFVAETMDENFKQMLRIAQEAKEGSTLSEIFNDLDLHGFKVKNLGPATNPNDAVSLGQYQADAAGASASKVAAQAAQTAAEAARDSATASKNASATSEANALSYKNAAATSAGNAATSETNAAASASAANSSKIAAATSETNAATSLTSFKRQYQGAAANDPTTRYDGTALQQGDLYFNTTNNAMMVYGTLGWKNAGSTVNGTAKRQVFTNPSVGQTRFTITGGYDANFADVYVNGIKLANGYDCDVTSGTWVDLTEGVRTTDVVDIICYGTFAVANTYTKAEADAFRIVPNRLRNGNGKIHQRTGTGGSADGTCLADGWFIGASVAGVSNMLGANNFGNNPSQTGGVGFGLATGATTKASLAAADIFILYQKMEGLFMADLQWGTSSAKPLTFSVRAYASQATQLAVSLRNGAFTRSYVFLLNLSAGYNYTAVTLPGCTDGVWASDNTLWGLLTIAGASGTTYSTATAASWVSGNYITTPGASNILDTANRSVVVSDVKLEAGSSATPYDWRDYGDEVRRCCRYFQTFAPTTSGRLLLNPLLGQSSRFAMPRLPVEMRIAPSVVPVNTAGTVNTLTEFSSDATFTVSTINEVTSWGEGWVQTSTTPINSLRWRASYTAEL